MKTKSILTLAIICSAVSVFAQEPVAVGKGSYASFPPPGLLIDNKTHADRVKETEEAKLYLVKEDDRPIPSNKWYEDLLQKPFGVGI